jgi:hypothetical protein
MSFEISVKRAIDGRWVAEPAFLPGRLVYGATREEAVLRAQELVVDSVGAAPGCHLDLDLEEDSPELEAELLKAAKGPFMPMRAGELRKIADQILREYRAKKQK